MEGQTPFDSERFYSAREVAEILGVQRQTVWRMVGDGRLPPMHPTAKRLRGDQLARWAQDGRPWREIAAAE